MSTAATRLFAVGFDAGCCAIYGLLTHCQGVLSLDVVFYSLSSVCRQSVNLTSYKHLEEAGDSISSNDVPDAPNNEEQYVIAESCKELPTHTTQDCTISPETSLEPECNSWSHPMHTLRRQNTLRGFDSSLASNGSIATICNRRCAGCTCNNGAAMVHRHDQADTTRELSSPKTTKPEEQNGYASGAAPFERTLSFRLSTRSIEKAEEEDITAEPCPCSKKKKVKRKMDMKCRRLLLLIAAFVAYVSLGAILFKILESGPELKRKESLEGFIEEFLIMYPCVNRSSIYQLMSKSVVDSEIVYYVVENKTNLDRWDFSGSFGFVVSVVTTIGFGNLSPFTLIGKGVCVLYAMIGIPLTLMVLSGIGEKMTHLFSRFRKTRVAMCHQSPVINKRINVVCIAIFGVITIFLMPALAFSYVEEWHFLEALYFCFTTLSTVGFGDYVIGIHEKRLPNEYTHGVYVVASYIWVLMGLAYLSLVYRVVTDKVVASAKRVERKTIRKLGPEYIRKIGESVSTTSTLVSSYSNNNNTLPPVNESDQVTNENEQQVEICQHL